MCRGGVSQRLASRPIFYYVVSVLLCIILWQIVGMNINPIFLATPYAVLRAFPPLVLSGELPQATYATMHVFVTGFAMAIGIGIPLGILFGKFRRVNYLTHMPLTIFYSIPYVALIPLFIVWTGLGTTTKILVVFISCLFPLLINTQAGVTETDIRLTEMARSFGGDERRMLLDVTLPASLPYIMSGVRIAVGRAIVGSIVAELTTAITGLGGMITLYGNMFATDRMMVPLLITSFVSITVTSIAKWMEDRFAKWKLA